MTLGLLITFEGPEGGGKTSQAAALRDHLEERGHPVRLYAEPGGTRISTAVRAILLAPEHTEMVPRAELLLFLAARAQLVNEAIRPALAAGVTVICDRYTDSTLAYQKVGAELPVDALERLNEFATEGLRPDLTLLLDVDVEEGLRRQGEWNRMEARGIEYHRQVRGAYLELAARYPERIRVIDASRSEREVTAAVREAVERLP